MKNKATNIITIVMIAVMVAISVAGCSVNEPEFTTIPTTATITETTEATTTTETTETETVATTTTETSEETSETTAATKATTKHTKPTSKKTATKPTSKKVNTTKKVVKKSPTKAPTKPSKGYAIVKWKYIITSNDHDKDGNNIKRTFYGEFKCYTTEYGAKSSKKYRMCNTSEGKAFVKKCDPNWRNYTKSPVKIVKFLKN